MWLHEKTKTWSPFSWSSLKYSVAMIQRFQMGHGVLMIILTTGQPSSVSISSESLRIEFALSPTSFSVHLVKNSLKSSGLRPSTLFDSAMLTIWSPSQVYRTSTLPPSFSITTGYSSAFEKYSFTFTINSSAISALVLVYD